MEDNEIKIDVTKRQTINPLEDEILRTTETLLKDAIKEFNLVLPLTFMVYNQIRFYEEFGKLHLGVSVASKETLAKQFGVSVKQINRAFNNLSTKYKLGKWIDCNEPVFRNVKRIWVSNVRYERGLNIDKIELIGTTVEYQNYYSVVPELLQRSSKTTTAEYLAPEVRPLSESKKKVSIKLSESNTITKVIEPKAKNEVVQYGKSEINELLEYWEKVVGYKIISNIKRNRFAINNLLKQKTKEEIQKIIDVSAAAARDQFGPRIDDFVSLQGKLNSLVAWYYRQQNQNKDNNFVDTTK